MTKKILVIGGDNHLLNKVNTWLLAAGYRYIECVTRGQEADRALQQQWDLVITDTSLSDLDVSGIARRVYDDRHESRILLLISQINTENVLRELNRRVDGYLLKPFGEKDFLEKVWLLAN